MKWADDDPPPNARGNAMTLTWLYEALLPRSQNVCDCRLCTIAREMLPCDDPEECERRIRQQDEQEERLEVCPLCGERECEEHLEERLDHGLSK
jgi:hypothetical protein